MLTDTLIEEMNLKVWEKMSLNIENRLNQLECLVSLVYQDVEKWNKVADFSFELFSANRQLPFEFLVE